MPEPPSHATKIVLNGVALGKEEVIAFIHFGHSNMEGRATTPEAERPYHFTDTDPHAFMYRVGSAPVLAHEPFTGCALANCPMEAGPGTALVKQALELAPKKYVLSIGLGHASALCSQYLPGGLYYDELTKPVIALKNNVTFAAIVIMLGINERTTDVADSQTGFAACMVKLVAAVRDAAGQPALPVLYSDYEMGSSEQYAPTGPIGMAVIPEIRRLPSLIARSIVVPTDGLPMQDNHHFDLQGHKIWTKRVLDTMQQQGWLPWADPATAKPM